MARYFCALLPLLFLLTSCRDVEGHLKVLQEFMLTDDDGVETTIIAGEYEAEFEMKERKSEIELEINDVVGDDSREFDFKIKNFPDTSPNDDVFELHSPASSNGQGVDLDGVATRKTGTFGPYMRDIAYCPSHTPYYTKAVVYDVKKTVYTVDATISSEEEELAEFNGSSCFLRTKARYCYDCYGYTYSCIYPNEYSCKN